MNKYTYSVSLNAFYPLALKPDYEKVGSWPGDAIEVSDEMANEYMAEPPEGKIRAVGDDGYPSWIDAPPPTHDEMLAAAEQKKGELLTEAQATISIWQTKLLLGIISDSDKASLIAWLAYIDELNAINTDAAPDINWPQAPEE